MKDATMRIEALKAQIGSKSYSVDCAAVADAIVERMLSTPSHRALGPVPSASDSGPETDGAAAPTGLGRVLETG